MILFTLGVGPVPWILVAEMFPVKTKCLASGIASFMCWLAGFIWTRFFREVAASYGILHRVLDPGSLLRLRLHILSHITARNQGQNLRRDTGDAEQGVKQARSETGGCIK
ncbi:hypothetical protein ACJJTC_001596 [Scirpophaga incertulas]